MRRAVGASCLGCFLLFLSACRPQAQAAVEVTRVALQTVVVTRIVPVLITMTPLPGTATPEPYHTPTEPHPYDYLRPPTITPMPTDMPEPTHVAVMTLQDPAIVVAQYFTLIGAHDYPAAYQLLGAHERTNSLEAFAEMAAQAYQEVQVLKVVRYNDWLKQSHANLPPGSENVYYVQLYVVGMNLTEMTPVKGIVVTYAWTARENGDIKIEFHGKLPQD